MSKSDDVKTQPACMRTGFCCERIIVDVSPRQLRESYESWSDGKKPKSNQAFPIVLSDIHLIFPMLEGRCLGRLPNGRFVYGPCKNLAYEEVEKDGQTIRLALCSIHQHKPHLCSSTKTRNLFIWE